MRDDVRRIRRRLRSPSRAVTLVEVMIVVAIMAVISSGATYLVFPEYKKARIKSAVVGASVIKTAAQTYMELDMLGGPDSCPTIEDLVQARKIDGHRTDDPWGIPYEIVCEDGEINVISAGHDRKFDTEDDLRDNLKRSEVERISGL
jgi:general secretion pathway protein G